MPQASDTKWKALVEIYTQMMTMQGTERGHRERSKKQ
jgi:hypothetical protein